MPAVEWKLKHQQSWNLHLFVIIRLCLDNVSRTGAIANMTCGEFKSAKNEGGKFMVNVFNHKTVATSGPKTMYFSNTLFKEANICFHKFRNKLDDATALEIEPFFVSYTMQKMSSSMVSAQINSFWSKSVSRKENRHRMNATMVRKSCVTKANEAKPNMAQDLANLMCHSKETAKRSYYLQEKSKNTARTSRQLHQLLRKNNTQTKEKILEEIQKYFSEEISKGKVILTIIKGKKILFEVLAKADDIEPRDSILALVKDSQKIGKGIVI